MKKHAENILLYNSPGLLNANQIDIVGIMVNVHFVIIGLKKNEPVADKNDL